MTDELPINLFVAIVLTYVSMAVGRSVKPLGLLMNQDVTSEVAIDLITSTTKGVA